MLVDCSLESAFAATAIRSQQLGEPSNSPRKVMGSANMRRSLAGVTSRNSNEYDWDANSHQAT